MGWKFWIVCKQKCCNGGEDLRRLHSSGDAWAGQSHAHRGKPWNWQNWHLKMLNGWNFQPVPFFMRPSACNLESRERKLLLWKFVFAAPPRLPLEDFTAESLLTLSCLSFSYLGQSAFNEDFQGNLFFSQGTLNLTAISTACVGQFCQPWKSLSLKVLEKKDYIGKFYICSGAIPKTSVLNGLNKLRGCFNERQVRLDVWGFEECRLCDGRRAKNAKPTQMLLKANKSRQMEIPKMLWIKKASKGNYKEAAGFLKRW